MGNGADDGVAEVDRLGGVGHARDDKAERAAGRGFIGGIPASEDRVGAGFSERQRPTVAEVGVKELHAGRSHQRPVGAVAVESALGDRVEIQALPGRRGELVGGGRGRKDVRADGRIHGELRGGRKVQQAEGVAVGAVTRRVDRHAVVAGGERIEEPATGVHAVVGVTDNPLRSL